MEPSTSPEQRTRQAALNALAVVGFVALIVLGIVAAVYAASFVPKALSRLAGANVYLSTLFNQQEDNQLEVIPQNVPFDTEPAATMSLPIDSGTSTPSVPTPQPTTQASSTPVVTPPQPSTPTYTPAPTYTAPPVPTTNYFGSADLELRILDVGYLRRGRDTDSFVRSNDVPNDKYGAVRYEITNRGTNVSDAFEVAIRVRTDGGTDTDTVRASSLTPGQTLTGFAYFDANSDEGDVDVRITADSDNDVRESDEGNNSDSESIDID